MSESDGGQHRSLLRRIAHRVMIEKGLVPDFPDHALAQLNAIHGPATSIDPSTRDQRQFAWCSIDNDDSRDLDQLTFAQSLPDHLIRIFVAIADVDAVVKKSSALDDHAMQNTTSVYTAAQIFPMLPEKLSTDFTSLNFDADRLAVVVEMTFDDEGTLEESKIYPAVVHNRAKLAYNSVAAWLDHQGPLPLAIAAVEGLEANIRVQDQIAQTLKDARHARGALDLETIQTRPVFKGDVLQDLVKECPNRAKELIAEFMIASNGVVARYLASRQFPSFRRVVYRPKRWDRIVDLAAEWGATLPREPDSEALENFLVAARSQDPNRFPDLSMLIIKLLGRGEYVAQHASDKVPGHFGLAVGDYAHSTAPNRRYPDIITQRLLKAALSNQSHPYTDEELDSLANHCTQSEDAAKKVERQVAKSAAALMLQSRIGDTFDAFVTGAAAKGTWVRITHPPIEGRLISGREEMDVGHRLRVKLVNTDVEQGFIDFKRA